MREEDGGCAGVWGVGCGAREAGEEGRCLRDRRQSSSKRRTRTLTLAQNAAIGSRILLSTYPCDPPPNAPPTGRFAPNSPPPTALAALAPAPSGTACITARALPLRSSLHVPTSSGGTRERTSGARSGRRARRAVRIGKCEDDGIEAMSRWSDGRQAGGQITHPAEPQHPHQQTRPCPLPPDPALPAVRRLRHAAPRAPSSPRPSCPL